MKIDSDSKYAQLFLDDNRNLTITNEKNPINKDLNLKLTTIENNKIIDITYNFNWYFITSYFRNIYYSSNIT